MSAEQPPIANSEANEPPASRLRPPRFGKTLRRAFRETWDHLGLVMAVNCIAFIVIIFPLSTADLFNLGRLGIPGWGCLAVVEAAIIAFCFAGLSSFARKLLAKEDVSLLMLWLDGARMFWLSIQVVLLDAIVMGVLITNIAFYLTRRSLFWNAIAFLIFDLFVVALVIGYLQPAVLANSDSEQGRRGAGKDRVTAITILRRPALLFFLESKFIIACFVVTALIGILLMATGIGLPLFGYGFSFIYITCVYQEIMACYGLAPEPFDPSKPVEDEWKGIVG